MSQPRRSTFALHGDAVTQLEKLVDRCEREHGFRPSMAQIVSGLIHQAAEGNRQ